MKRLLVVVPVCSLVLLGCQDIPAGPADPEPLGVLLNESCGPEPPESPGPPTEPGPPPDVGCRPVESVTVSPHEATIEVSETIQLEATLRDKQGQLITNRDVSWSSSDLLIADVDADGLVTGVTPGSALITATSEGVSGEATIEVVVPPPLFFEDFSGDLSQWTLRGSPQSFITTAEGNPAPSLSVNGDASFDSGIESLRKFDAAEVASHGGITVTFDLLRPDTPLGLHFIDGGVYLGTVNVDGFAIWAVGIRYQPNSFLMGKFGFFVNTVSHLSDFAVTERRWIPLRIVLRSDMVAEYYVDDVLRFTSPEPIILPAGGLSVAVTGRAHFVDNIEVLAGLHRP